MKDQYCFDISFPNIEFDSYLLGHKESALVHHAHLLSEENEIEIRILYDSKTYFGKKLSHWVSQKNWKKFGSFLQITNETQNEGLQKIDITNASLLSITNGSNQFEGNLQYVSIKIDSVKFYWVPSGENINTGEFYLNEAGFNVVKDFYTPLLGINSEFHFNRMDGMDVFYKIGNIEFRPEFHFYSSDSKNKNEALIIKEPKIQFRYDKNTTENEVIKYSDLIRLIASFYFHTPIDYTVSKIRFENNTIITKKVEKKNVIESSGNFFGLGNFWKFDQVMNSEWPKSAVNNHEKLIVVISRFLHAKSVYDSSKFLIYYSILEYLKALDTEIKTEFSFIEKRKKNAKCDEAINILTEIVPKEEIEEFKIKLDSLKGDLKYRPMKHPLEEFLSKNNINLESCSINIKKLIAIRNSLIHGSSEVINYDEIEKANILLYRITGILILQLIGINEYRLDLHID